ncbi:hypothetical protein VTN02DRAFT_3168 [Thermoascus thermophilus]
MSQNKRSRATGSPRKMVPSHGCLINNIWHCNCDPRLPAAYFETKKPGKNQGKWFYTCQKPQGERCNFFLWADDAKVREKTVLLANAQSEPDVHRTPKTPSRSIARGSGLLTPATTGRGGGRYRDALEDDVGSPLKSQKSSQTVSDDEDSLGWDEGLDDEVERILGRPPNQPNLSPETPQKTPKTAGFTSPRKRKLEEITAHDTLSETQATPRTGSQQNPVLTPTSQRSSQADYLLPPSVEIATTPTPSRYTNVLAAPSHSDNSELATSALAVLSRHDVVLPTKAKDELVALLNKHELRAQGIVRGRDITRLALRKKDDTIKELNERIQVLEAQREMDRAVIDGLKKESQ